jgi:hypothetical protein
MTTMSSTRTPHQRKKRRSSGGDDSLELMNVVPLKQGPNKLLKNPM